MTQFPIIISIKKYSAYNSCRNALIKHNLPTQNYYEFSCVDNGLNINLHNKFGSLVTNVRQIPDYNGDLWLIGKGFSDESKQFPVDYRFGLFFDFDFKANTGFLFNNFMLHRIIDTFFKPQRLFLFACYQGKYLANYKQSLPNLQQVHGFDDAIDFAQSNQHLLQYFSNKSTYQMPKSYVATAN